MNQADQIRMRLLAEQAVVVVFAMVHKKSEHYRLFPVEAHGTHEYANEMRAAIAEGYKPLGVIALCSTADNQPLIEDEAIEGTDPKDMTAARQLFVEGLVGKGVLKPDTPRA